MVTQSSISRRGFSGLLLIAVAVCSLLYFTLADAQAQSREYELKAVFLFNFTQFIKWPPSALPPGAPFTIGLMGADPFAGALDKAVEGESVGGRKIAIRRGGDMQGCQVVFVSRAGGTPAGVQGPGVLTVGEAAGFARAGGIIEFILQGNNVAFQINAEAAQRAGLQVSSKLLKLAK